MPHEILASRPCCKELHVSLLEDKMMLLHTELFLRTHRIAADDTIKVADFGLAEDVYTRKYFKSSNSEKMPIKWMAPESLKLCVFSEKTDIVRFCKLALHNLVNLANFFKF